VTVVDDILQALGLAQPAVTGPRDFLRFFLSAADQARVVPGSLKIDEGVLGAGNAMTVSFTVEDCDTDVTVIHTGVPPQLFQEGIGVVVEGTWDGTVFESDTMLVKHDEQYRTDDEHYDTERHACSDA